ncbi:septal ring factor EnvC (AmiA/AmiB activator) [Paenibacillus phyllosphaerae]|uniref:Septal ring factor EnvC (AmiA/AmiB activator) n=1 Tax=Paenibacillus phyllosphaerae TaxID=274593 RepID=A0A7W5B2D9_9BACL|nr:hypothetical protein [Paenibacillus phyllosphaerae]MBB3112914.1 septal ring factor EnvC (AmiA/AmiB activator) [Paenibacillus phyllosphaerae]
MAAVLLGGLLAFGSPSADANVIDRFKDIYNAPEKLDELQSEFAKAQAALDKAEEQAQEYAQKQLELAEQNEAYRQQNEALLQQNQELLQRLDQLQNDQSERTRFYRKIAASVLVFAGMGLLYIISVRVWRYLAWRRHHRNAADGEGQ